jgi:hypothetical protein
MQHTIQYMLLSYIAGNALWQAYTAARWLARRFKAESDSPVAHHPDHDRMGLRP